MSGHPRRPGQRAAEALVIMDRWFPPGLVTTAGYSSDTGAIEIQLHDSHLSQVRIGDGYRLAGWLLGAETYDFHDVVRPYETQRHHHWRGVYTGLAVTIAWVETLTPERKDSEPHMPVTHDN